MKRWLKMIECAVLLGMLVCISPVDADAQWQTPQYSIPIGEGPGFTGFNSAAPGAAGTLLQSNGASSNPTFKQPAIKDGALAFGFVCDGTTNNDTALASAKTFIEATGGHVALPQGVCNYNTAFTLAAAYGGGFVGQGGGTNQPTSSAPIGTQLRFTGTTGDSFTISGGVGTVLWDVSFFPTKYRANTCEVKLTNRANTPHLRNIKTVYGYRSICVVDAVFPLIENPVSQTATGDADYYVAGVNGSGGALIDGTLIVNPIAEALPAVAFSGLSPSNFVTSRGNSTAYGANTVILFGGYWWSTTAGGTSGGSPPTVPTWVNSTDPRTMTMIDGTITWTWVAKDDKAGILIDSGAFYVTVRGGYLPPAGEYAVLTQNTLAGGPAPKYITIEGMQSDHNITSTVQLNAGSNIRITNNWFDAPFLGRNVGIGAAVSGVQVIGNPFIGSAGLENVRSESSAVDVTIANNIFAGGNWSAGANCSVTFAAGSTDYQVTSNQIRAGLGAAGTTAFGICDDVGNDRFIYSGNSIFGQSVAAISNGAGLGGNKIITGNNPPTADNYRPGGGFLAISGNFGLTVTIAATSALTLPSALTIPSIAQGDVLYGSATGVLSALAKNTTATRYISNTGTSNNPAWAQIDLTNGVTGTLPVGNGGSGAATFTANAVLKGNTTSAFIASGVSIDSSNNMSGIANISTSGTAKFNGYAGGGQFGVLGTTGSFLVDASSGGTNFIFIASDAGGQQYGFRNNSGESFCGETTGAFDLRHDTDGKIHIRSANGGALCLANKIRGAGAAPAVSSCGTTPAISGSDLAGMVTTGTGTPTSCTITFNAAYAAEPYCMVHGKTQSQVTAYTVSSSAIVVTTTATDNVPIEYICIARSAG